MKYLYTLVTLCFALLASAQEYKVAHNGGSIILSNVDDVKIYAYDGTEVIFSAKLERGKEESKRAEGLKVINSLGLDDNSGLGLSVQKDGENLKVIQIGDCCNHGEGYTIKIPKSMGIDFSHSTHNSEDLKIYDVSKEIVVSANYTDITLEDVTGPMSIKTVYGNIEAKFAELDQNSSVSINSVYGFVDAAIPSNSKAQLSLRTPYGQIYTDFDIKMNETNGMKELSSKNIKGTINSGGVDFILKSGYESIYLRKK